MDRMFTIIGAVMAFLGVALGAFGAHGLEQHFNAEPSLRPIYRTAVEYHMYHALAILAVAWLASRFPGGLTNGAGYLFLCGIIVFCGSLYTLSVTGAKWLGAITPIGGLAFLAGWACLIAAAWKAASK